MTNLVDTSERALRCLTDDRFPRPLSSLFGEEEIPVLAGNRSTALGGADNSFREIWIPIEMLLQVIHPVLLLCVR
jgi:hypothetical protein